MTGAVVLFDLPSVFPIAQSWVHFTKYDTKLPLLTGLQLVTKSPVSEAIVADDRNVTLLPVKRNSIIIVDFYKRLQI